MNYTLSLNVKTKEANKLKELIAADGLDFGERSSVDLVIDKGLSVNIKAQDATSLRASINGVLKTLQIYEKSGKI